MYRIALLLIGCALVGCASIDTTRGAPSDRDPVQQYQAPYQQVVRATRESLPILGFHIRQDQELSDVEHVMIAERSAHGASWGELVPSHCWIKAAKWKPACLPSRGFSAISQPTGICRRICFGRSIRSYSNKEQWRLAMHATTL